MFNSLIVRARLFDFHARHLWRFHRVVARRHLSKRCLNCAISEVCSPLDAAGVCAECRTHQAKARNSIREITAPTAELAAALTALLRNYEGAGKGAYDALVMLSGGKDSALLIHELQQRHPKLRLLAMTIDNSYMSPVALQNCARIVDTLNVDHVSVRLAKSVYAKSFRFACCHVEDKKGAFETVDRIDADLGFSQAKIYAATHRIPLLLSGLSWTQVERLFGLQSFEVPQEQALAKVTSTLGVDLNEIYDASELRYWWDPQRFDKADWPRFVHPFYAWRMEEQDIRDRVVNLGLIKPGNDSPLLTNNVLIPMMIVADFHNQGYASFEPEFACLVREGKAARLFWRNVFEMLEYSAKTGWMLEKEIDKLASSIGLTRHDLGINTGTSRRTSAESQTASSVHIRPHTVT